jgi:flagellar basal body-associated protein FliL
MATLSTSEKPVDLYTDPLEKKATEHDEKMKKMLIIGVIVAIGLTIIAVTVAYFLWPQPFQNFFTSQISVANGLLFIGVPLVAAGILIRLVIHVAQKYQKEKKDIGIWDDRISVWGHTLKALAPTKKQALAAIITTVVIAAVAVGLYFLFIKLDAASEWLNQSVINNNIHMWQAFAYIGGGAAAAITITFLALHIILWQIQKQEDKRHMDYLDKLIHAGEID